MEKGLVVAAADREKQRHPVQGRQSHRLAAAVALWSALPLLEAIEGTQVEPHLKEVQLKEEAKVSVQSICIPKSFEFGKEDALTMFSECLFECG